MQGQFTNDLRLLDTQPCVYGLWLSVKGKVLADSFVLRAAGGFHVLSYDSSAATLRERLESFIIADDVAVEDATADWAAVSLIGDAPAVAPTGVTAFPGRRTRPPNREWVFPVAREAEVVGALAGWRELTAQEIARGRVAAGIPAVPTDIGPNDLPNEAGLEAETISYTKGCYLGQEVMARLKSMGRVRRRLLRVHGGAEPAPTLPVPLFTGGRQVGELRSTMRDDAGALVGFAMLSLPNIHADSQFGYTADGPAPLALIDQP